MSAHRKTPSSGPDQRLLRVLLVEDSPSDAALLRLALEEGGFNAECERVQTGQSMELALEKVHWDLILADHSMPGFSAEEAFHLVRKRGRDIPFIIVSGHIDDEAAVAMMKAGAHDYIMKDRLARLAPAVERELHEAQVRLAQQQAQEELRRAREELETRVEKRTADLKSANLKLQSVIEERKRLENELLEIAENERRRIGFDLHDDLGQKLTGLSFMAKGLERRLAVEHHPAAAEAREIHALIDEANRHTHDLARHFSSLDARGEDLPSVLKELAANVKKLFGIQCGFSVRGVVPALPPNIAMQLYKISQEAISNSIKHGKARHVSISLARNTADVVLTIKNDGLPFSAPDPARNRMGLRIMNYRASTIGASIDIKPAGDRGAIMTCALPLKGPVLLKDAAGN